ncbi:flagellin N-terminal helical domain-containing protein [Mangrovitalea sediminis]|uniref:flagellin N-terminal helical domain-containing protein n=1 Tax=Mangrovitalea sediminis TaxID=1982043 RepID=UPI000BE6040A|nr:flagellin [Mangrovitalea sediminis]
MPQIINTNIASINAQRNLDRSQSDYQTALQRLSSGLRINSAKDDAAGLAISTRLTTQTRGLAVAIRNAGDGVSLAQTAEGALGSMTTSLQRIRDLALESANATNSSVDREALNQEVQQLKSEIKRVSEQTNFNGTKLLDGSFSDVTFQIGANRGESVTFGIAAATTDKLGTSQTDGISSNPSSADMAAGDLVINGIAVPASTGADDSYSSAGNTGSSIAKAAAINKVTDQTGVKAIVNANSVGGSTAFSSAGSPSTTVTINGVSISLVTSSSLSAKVNLENVAGAINDVSGQTGVRAVTTGDPKTGIELIADDGRNITIDASGSTADPKLFGLTDIGGFGTASNVKTIAGTFTLVSPDGSNIKLDTSTGNIANAGLQVGTFSGDNSGAVSKTENSNAMQTGDLVVNGVPVGGSSSSDDTASPDNPAGARATSAIAKAAAINKVTVQTGVTAKVNETIYNGSAITTSTTAEAASFDLNGVTVNVSWSGSDSPADRQRAIVTAINNKAGQTGISAEAFGSTFRLIAQDGRNIVLDNFNVTSGGPAGNSTDLGFVGADGTTAISTGAATANDVTRGSVTLESAGQIKLGTLTGAIANSGFEVGNYGSSQDGELVKDIDISTVAGALKALTSVDNALNQINFQRAQLGAIQNRFDSTISNQQIASENLTTANSRITDADFAAETAALSRSQVLQQAGLSILAQANAQPQQVLKLLQ